MRFPAVTTLRRYLLFQLPGWLIAAIVVAFVWQKGFVAARTAGALLAAWVAKDFLLYPLVKGAYRKGTRRGDSGLLDADAVAVEALAPEGLVRVRGELWRAQTEPGAVPIEAGRRVRVLAVDGLKLTVSARPGP